MNPQDWNRLNENLEKARTGSRAAAWLACEILELHAKQAITMRLWAAGVPRHDVEDAYHDVIIRVVERLHQLKDVLCFAGWLRSIEREIAANYRPPFVRLLPEEATQSNPPSPPKEIGEKWTETEDGQHPVRIFESAPKLEERPRKQLRFAELTDLAIWRQNSLNRPDYVPSIDMYRLLSQLPPLQRRVTVLRYFEDMDYEGIARTLGVATWKAKKLIAHAMTFLRRLCGIQVVQIAPGYEVRYFPQFLQKPQADVTLSRLLWEIPYRSEEIGLPVEQSVSKRWTAQFGIRYDYNPEPRKARLWPRLLTELKVLVEMGTGTHFNSGQCSLYPTSEADIDWHHDSGHPKMIASLSLGSVHEIRFAQAGSSQIVNGLKLGHGSLLLIPGSVNERYQHMVPRSKYFIQPRCRVTFRSFSAG